MQEIEERIRGEQSNLVRLKAELIKLKKLKAALAREGVSLAHESDLEAIGLGRGDDAALMRPINLPDPQVD